MAWPFTASGAPPAPNLDSGFVSIPTTSTLVPTVAGTGTQVWILGGWFNNPTQQPIRVSVTDGAGNSIVPNVEVPAGGMVPMPPTEFMPSTGLLWQATAAGLIGKIWGYF